MTVLVTSILYRELYSHIPGVQLEMFQLLETSRHPINTLTLQLPYLIPRWDVFLILKTVTSLFLKSPYCIKHVLLKAFRSKKINIFRDILFQHHFRSINTPHGL